MPLQRPIVFEWNPVPSKQKRGREIAAPLLFEVFLLSEPNLIPLKGTVGENATMVGCHPLVNEIVDCRDLQTEKTAQNDFGKLCATLKVTWSLVTQVESRIE